VPHPSRSCSSRWVGTQDLPQPGLRNLQGNHPTHTFVCSPSCFDTRTVVFAQNNRPEPIGNSPEFFPIPPGRATGLEIGDTQRCSEASSLSGQP
jgi:hypothetical protein